MPPVGPYDGTDHEDSPRRRRHAAVPHHRCSLLAKPGMHAALTVPAAADVPAQARSGPAEKADQSTW